MEHCIDARDHRERKSRKKSFLFPLYSPVINFIRQIAELQQWTIVFFGHCTLYFLRANDLSLPLLPRRTVSIIIRVSDGRRRTKREKRRKRDCTDAHVQPIDRQPRNTQYGNWLLREIRSQEARGSPRLASVVTRRECAIIALRTRRCFQAHVGLRLSS